MKNTEKWLKTIKYNVYLDHWLHINYMPAAYGQYKKHEPVYV